MNTIGFKYFRRFENFPEMNLGDITLLVGGNNSGKSTVVKALLLCVDNIRLMKANTFDDPFNLNLPQFRFDANEWHDVKIKTFSRAIHNKEVEITDITKDEMYYKGKPNRINFVFTLSNFKFEIEVIRNESKDNNEVTGSVTLITIEDRKNMCKFYVNYEHQFMSYATLANTSEETTLVQKLARQFADAEDELNRLVENGDDIAAITSANEKLSQLKKQIREFLSDDADQTKANEFEKMIVDPLMGTYNPGEEDNIDDDFDYKSALRNKFKKSYISELDKSSYSTAQLPLEEYLKESEENLLLHIISNFIGFGDNPGSDSPEWKEEYENNDKGGLMYEADVSGWMYVQEARQTIKQDKAKIERSKEDLRRLLNDIRVEYITAHGATQDTLFNTSNRNDYVAQTIHDFYKAKIKSGTEIYRFIRQWMKNFEIGSSFRIVPVEGEAYQVKIIDFDGSIVNLADKGMGSIQMMVLLLKLATIMQKYNLHLNNSGKENSIRPTIIIEEPEQNLHPKMQSLLADLFLLMSKKYNCSFIVETHSEYIIRKTQILVKREKFNEEELSKYNHFCVYYFESAPKRQPYYKMEYRTDGCFANDFGDGFFDEAENLAFEIL